MKRLLQTAFIVTVHILLCATTLHAQEAKKLDTEYSDYSLYTYAERYYEYGYFDNAISYLDKLITSGDVTMRSSAYYLMALCHIEQGNIEAAKKDVKDLLTADPYFSPSASSNPIFLNLVNTNKNIGSATITTASQQTEDIEESPVPVTLITEEMIHAVGARTLKEALIAYVPGITNIETNDETNLAMRGLYSGSQEVMLVMLNGHRLNSYSTNTSRPDFSISLDKVEQIEVLRGPASSLYGGVALAGVVNIITKSGAKQNGLTANMQYGNYHQAKGSVVMGKHMFNTDVLAWASIYNSKGEKIDIPESEQHSLIPCPGNFTIGGFNQRPSYDYGFTLKYGDFSMMLNNTFSKTVAQYSLCNTPFNYDVYTLMDGNKPGAFTHSTRIELAFDHSLSKNLSFKVAGFYDAEENNRYQVIADNWGYVGYKVPVIGTAGDSLAMGDYAFQEAKWKDQTLGALLHMGYRYKKGKHEGNIMFGMQFTKTYVSDSYFAEGDNCELILCTSPELIKGIKTGDENSVNAFVQYKHVYNKHWILNAGIRYDNKQHTFYNRIKEWSPRMSLVYLHPTWNAKVSYSKSFVDASYFCRLNTFDTSQGDPALSSEYQHSLQAAFEKRWSSDFSTELNAFYNHTSNIVIPSGFFVNAGSLDNYGIECVSKYNAKKWDAYLSAIWQNVASSEGYNAVDNVIYNVPNISANIVLTYRPIKQWRISAHANVIGKQTSYYQMTNMENVTVSEYFNIPAHILLNMNTSYALSSAVTLKADCHNIAGKQYVQGGGSQLPLYQQSRWYTLGVEIKL